MKSFEIIKHILNSITSCYFLQAYLETKCEIGMGFFQ